MAQSPSGSDAATVSKHSSSSSASTTAEVLGAAEPAVSQWSMRKEAQDFLRENTLLLGITVPIGSAYMFRETYRAYPSSRHRFLRALVPAALCAPVAVASVAGFEYLGKGTDKLFADENTLARPLVAGALAGAMMKLGDGRRAMARSAVPVSALMVAVGAVANYIYKDELEQGTERASGADTDSDSSQSSARS